MDFVRLYDEEDLQTLPAGLWGIPEPTAEWRSEKRQSGMCNGTSSTHWWLKLASFQSRIHHVKTLT